METRLNYLRNPRHDVVGGARDPERARLLTKPPPVNPNVKQLGDPSTGAIVSQGSESISDLEYAAYTASKKKPKPPDGSYCF